MNLPKDMTGSGSWNNRQNAIYAAVLLAACILTWYMRIRGGFPHYLDGMPMFGSNDAHEHLRRMELLFANLPYIPAVDRYTGYPYGTPPLWVPLFDYVTVFIAKCRGDQAFISVIAPYIQPSFAVVNTILVFLLVNRMFDCKTAAIASLLQALLPVDVSASTCRDIGHHVAEVTVVILFFLSLYTLDRKGSWRIATQALLFFVSLFTWRGSTLIWAAFTAGVAFYGFIMGETGYLKKYSQSAAIAAVAVLISCQTGFLGAFDSFMFNTASYMSVALLLAIAALFPAGIFLKRQLDSRRRSLYALCAIVAAAAISCLMLPQFSKAATVILGTDSWLDAMLGYHSIFGDWSRYLGSDKFDILDIMLSPISYLSIFFYLVPLAGFLLWREDKDLLKLSLLLVSGSILVLLPISKARYALWAAPVIDITGGYLIARELTAKRVANAASLSFGFAVTMLLAYTSDLADPGKSNAPLIHAMAWMRNNTPETQGLYLDAGLPEYGVMSRWDMGPFITHVARRPTVGTQYGWETYGLAESALVFGTESDETAKKVFTKNRVGYLVISEKHLSQESVDNNRQLAGLPTGIKVDDTFIYRAANGKVSGLQTVYDKQFRQQKKSRVVILKVL